MGEVDDGLRKEIEDRRPSSASSNSRTGRQANLEERVDGTDEIDPFVLERLRRA